MELHPSRELNTLPAVADVLLRYLSRAVGHAAPRVFGVRERLEPFTDDALQVQAKDVFMGHAGPRCVCVRME